MVSSRRVVLAGVLVVAVAAVAVVAFGLLGGDGDTAPEPTTTETPGDTTPGETTTAEPATDGGEGSEAPELFASAERCKPCHDQVPTEGDEEVEIHGDWEDSMMAGAADDPYFRAKLVTEVEHFPELEAVIEDKCQACHMPMGKRQASADGERLDFDAVQAGESPYQGLATEGVSCTVCHQIEAEGLGTPKRFTGNFTIDGTTAKPNRSAYGPYEPVSANVMQGASGYEPKQADHMRDAALCGSCHTLYTPTVNYSGAVVGEFPEQTPFLEWRESDYADDTTCQSCHMPSVEGAQASSVPYDLPSRTVGQHQFAGANAQVASVMGNDAFAERARGTLRSAVDVEITSLERTDEGLRVTVSVASDTGHKFPSGFPSRRAWLRLSVTDGSGATVFESGALDGNRIVGRDDGYEPHHERITAEDQVQIYQAVMGDVNGDVTRTLLRADGYLKDNRIPPRGFDNETAPADVGVFGAASDDGDFGGGGDTVTYVIETDADAASVEAEMLFQPISRPFLRAQADSDDETVTAFLEDYDSVDQTTVVETANATLAD